jgi:hypothetical protein
MNDRDPFESLALNDEQLREFHQLKAASRKTAKPVEKFIKVPMAWRQKLVGATGNTILIALDLLYLAWKDGRDGPVKLPNAALRRVGIGRQSKWRALGDLERRGLVAIDRRSGRSPLVRLLQRRGS